MNKQYIIDTEGKVNVVTDTEEFIEKEIYTKNTDEILSLENFAESIENKIQFLTRNLNEINNTIRRKNKTNRRFNIALAIIIFILSILSAIISTKLFLLTIISLIPISIITGLIETMLTKKDKEERNHLNERISEETYQLNKIKEKIIVLSKDKTPKEIDKPNTFIEVKPINNYNLDAEEYFINKYKIDKRAKEMLSEKKNIKKLTRKRNNNSGSIYQI